MKNNDGFKPSQIESIKRRGLNEIVEKWIDLIRQGRPNIRNPVIAAKGQEAFPIVYSAVDGYLRSKNEKFDGDSILKLLKELKLLPDNGLQQYISKVEEFILELSRAAKSSQRA